MLRTLIACLTLLFFISASAQIQISTDSVNFGSVTKGSPVSKGVQIQNDFDFDVRLTITSTHEDFEPEINSVNLAKKSNQLIEITFDPIHNVKYNGELIISTNSKAGAHSVDLVGQGVYADTYYSATENLWDEKLKSELKSIISKGYVNLGYSTARDRMYGSIDNFGGDVTCVYTGRSATFNTRSGANSNNFNTEHTWPQSLFNQDEPERADIHHLFPTDVSANSRRSNFQFGEVGSSTWSSGGSKLGGGKFEPRDEHKGDCARAMFYFSTRYTNYSSFLTGQEAILRTWASNHPPTKSSNDRNNAIFGYQKNRNPFVDHPEFLDRIQSISSTSTRPELISVEASTREINMGSFPASDNYGYRLVLTNQGNTEVTYTGIDVLKPEFTMDNSGFSILPGESITLFIGFGSSQTIGTIEDTLRINSANTSIQFKIPISGVIQSLSAKTIVTKPTLIIHDNLIHINYSMGHQLSIYTMSGQLVLLNELSSSFTELSLHHLSSGVYFAILSNGMGSTQIKKFQVRP